MMDIPEATGRVLSAKYVGSAGAQTHEKTPAWETCAKVFHLHPKPYSENVPSSSQTVESGKSRVVKPYSLVYNSADCLC